MPAKNEVSFILAAPGTKLYYDEGGHAFGAHRVSTPIVAWKVYHDRPERFSHSTPEIVYSAGIDCISQPMVLTKNGQLLELGQFLEMFGQHPITESAYEIEVP